MASIGLSDVWSSKKNNTTIVPAYLTLLLQFGLMFSICENVLDFIVRFLEIERKGAGTEMWFSLVKWLEQELLFVVTRLE